MGLFVNSLFGNGNATYTRSTDTLTGYWHADNYSVANYNSSTGNTDHT